STAAVEDVTISCAINGAGPPLMLPHGYLQNQLTWRHVAPPWPRTIRSCWPTCAATATPASPPRRRHQAWSPPSCATSSAASRVIPRLGTRSAGSGSIHRDRLQERDSDGEARDASVRTRSGRAAAAPARGG